jgi:hypothetical protein
MIRFEILLPLFYNDGRLIEPEKFVATDDPVQTSPQISRHINAHLAAPAKYGGPRTPMQFSC